MRKIRHLPRLPDRQFASLDGVRALAALLVVLHHAGFDSGFTFRNSFGDFAARGDIGVPIFFGLSGFLLYRPFLRANLDASPAPSMPAFWWRRVLRIVPAYWLALTGCALLFHTRIGGFYDAIWYYSLTQIYSARHALGGLPQAWSLCTEMSFYFFLPLYARLARHFGKGRPVNEFVGIAGLFLVSVAYRAAIYTFDPTWAGTALFWLPAHLDFFAVGMAVALLVTCESPTPIKIRSLLQRLTFPLVLMGIASFVIVSKVVGLPKGIAWVPGRQAFERQTLYTLVAASLLLIGVCSPSRTAATRFLRSFVMSWLGVLSYGIYLWHKSLVEKATTLFGGRYFDAHFAVVAAAGTLGAVVIAALTLRYFERPLERFKSLVH